MNEELELAAATGLTPRFVASRCAAPACSAGSERGLGYLREAVELLAGSAARLQHARALVDYGAALRRSRPASGRPRSYCRLAWSWRIDAVPSG